MRQPNTPDNSLNSQIISIPGLRNLLLAVAAAASLVSCQSAPDGPVAKRFDGNNSFADAAAAGFSTSDAEMESLSDMVMC